MMRSTDHWWLDGSALHLLLPETGRTEAEQLVQRLRGAMQLPTDVRLAVFPFDGLTPGALRAALDACEERPGACLLYTSDAADDLLCVDLGGRRIIKKK